jgi:hypothetical protein
MDYLRVALHPYKTAPQRRLLFVQRRAEEDRRFGNIDPVAELCVKIETNVACFGRRAQITE